MSHKTFFKAIQSKNLKILESTNFDDFINTPHSKSFQYPVHVAAELGQLEVLKWLADQERGLKGFFFITLITVIIKSMLNDLSSDSFILNFNLPETISAPADSSEKSAMPVLSVEIIMIKISIFS